MKFFYSNFILFISIVSGYSQIVDPFKFLATLKFDDQYLDYLINKKEQVFPISFNFNITQDGNGDGIQDVEDACENIVRYAIGDSIFGTGRTGISNRGPNDQRPVIYFHFFKRENYDVYEYWLYYADNDYLNDHEHDWEKYFVFAQDSNPVYVMISSHSSFNTFSWCELPKDNNHPIIGVEGGSHAMGNANQNGVKIGYNGEISKNSGKLDFGDGQIFPWRIFSNDSNANDLISFTESPDEFFHGDPVYPDIPQLSSSEEYGSPSDAPWKRSEWDDPPGVPIVFLGADTQLCQGDSLILNAGPGYSSYIWTTGESTQSIKIHSSGTFFVEVIENNGCTSKDTITISACTKIIQSQFEKNVWVTQCPTKGKILIRVNKLLVNNFEELSFSLLDMNGKQLKRKLRIINEVSEFNVPNLSPGYYPYRICRGNEIICSGKIFLN